MSETQSMPVSKRMVVEAGRIIAAWNPYPYSADVYDAFRIANEWRGDHLKPMQKVRRELRAFSDKHGLSGAITVARLKRMQSLRRKLRNSPLTLFEIQDIGGCRAITDTIQQAELLRSAFAAGGPRHEVVRQDNYIASPKASGYRGFHLRTKLRLTDDDQGLNRYKIEVQVRTRLQHAWATAVEAVGLVNNENLKAGSGSADWLRLFALMASEMAAEEQGALVPGASDTTTERRAEIRDIEARLDAVRSLDSYARAIRHTEAWRTLRGDSFLIRYNNATKRVDVRSADLAYRVGDDVALDGEAQGINSVLVEVDRVQDLREAYPNYFLDVGLFNSRLKRAAEPPRRTTQTKLSLADLKWWKGFQTKAECGS